MLCRMTISPLRSGTGNPIAGALISRGDLRSIRANFFRRSSACAFSDYQCDVAQILRVCYLILLFFAEFVEGLHCDHLSAI